MPYKIIAGIVVLAVATSLFIYSLTSNNSAIEEEIEIQEIDGTTLVNPSGNGPFPTTEPHVPVPVSP